MRTIEVVDYRPDWQLQFKTEATAIKRLLGPCLIKAHHIGSTSVPGLAAKPIIDILLEVRDLKELNGFDAGMADLSYEAMGEFGIERRRFYRKGGDLRTHHVHAFLAGDEHVGRHLAFRDYLVAHPQVQAQYACLKRALARRFLNSSEDYCSGKDSFVRKVERQALDWSVGKLPKRP